MKAKISGLVALSVATGGLAPAVVLYPGWLSTSALALSAVAVAALAGLILGEIDELQKGGSGER